MCRMSFAPVCLAACAMSAPAGALAQDEGTVESLGVYRAEPPQTVDLTIRLPEEPGEAERRECERQQAEALPRNEIVVCAGGDDPARYRTMDRESARERYARETNRQGEFGAPDGVNGVAGPGIFRGKPTIGGLCVPGLQKCPPPPAYIVDFDALPDAPPGSDADRIARGLAPRGYDDTPPAEVSGGTEPQADEPEAEVTPTEAASPAEPR